MGRTLRQFMCRDDLWARVEALSERRGLSTDDVVQAALVQLFSKKNSRSTTELPQGQPLTRTLPQSPQQPPPPRSSPPPPRATGSRPATTGPSRLPPPNGRSAPTSRPLYLYYEGQCYAVDQDQFVIGRGSKYSDLAIKDANISRRHCAIVRRNGEYFIKDLESTNGIEYNGERVDDHLIQEGSSYRLCDHEIRFSFIPPS